LNRSPSESQMSLKTMNFDVPDFVKYYLRKSGLEGEYILRLHNMNPEKKEVVKLNNFMQVFQEISLNHQETSSIQLLSLGNTISNGLKRRILNMVKNNRSSQKSGIIISILYNIK
jgi:hypothetical protein